MAIDPICDAVLNSNFQDPVMTQDAQPDEFEKFLESAELAGAAGRHGWRLAEGLRLESQKPLLHKKETSEEWDAEVDGGALEKSMSSDAKKAAYKQWIKAMLSKGETVSDLISHAKAGGDPETAKLIAAIAETL
jgi:hypothetical protein